MYYLQQIPPDTSAYMIAGYAVIFGAMFLYVTSLFVRRRNLEQDIQLLEELEQNETSLEPVRTGVQQPVKKADESEAPAARTQ
jgi:hypothetical protein